MADRNNISIVYNVCSNYTTQIRLLTIIGLRSNLRGSNCEEDFRHPAFNWLDPYLDAVHLGTYLPFNNRRLANSSCACSECVWSCVTFLISYHLDCICKPNS